MKYSTMVITDESHVPSGYVRISELASDKSAVKYVSKLHCDGLVPAVKLMRTAKDHSGPVWVDRKITEQMLDRMTAAPAGLFEAKSSNDLLDHSDLLERIVRCLERANDPDEINQVAIAVERLGSAITPAGTAAGIDAAGGNVNSLTEAVMGMTAALVQIARAIEQHAHSA